MLQVIAEPFKNLVISAQELKKHLLDAPLSSN